MSDWERPVSGMWHCKTTRPVRAHGRAERSTELASQDHSTRIEYSGRVSRLRNWHRKITPPPKDTLKAVHGIGIAENFQISDRERPVCGMWHRKTTRPVRAHGGAEWPAELASQVYSTWIEYFGK